MPNTNRPEDTRCPADDHVIECRTPRANEPAGVCTHCGLGSCALCGGPMTPEQCATSRVECPVPDRNEVYCPACLKEVCEGPSDGVPVAVEEEASEAQTVRAAYEPIGPAGLGEVRAKMPLKAEAVALLASLPRQVRTCQPEYAIALALSREALVRLDQRTVLGNGQVRYLVEVAS